MEGFIAGKLQELVDKFNTSQEDYEVQFIRKGNYAETFQKGVRATKNKKNPPHILQVYEIAIQSLMLPSTTYLKGIRLPGFVEVREILIDALEGAFEGKNTPKEELDAAVIKGNKLIRQAKKEAF